jgi:hypothetical protein
MNKSETVLIAIAAAIKTKTETLVTIGRHNAYGFVENNIVDWEQKKIEREVVFNKLLDGIPNEWANYR